MPVKGQAVGRYKIASICAQLSSPQNGHIALSSAIKTKGLLACFRSNSCWRRNRQKYSDNSGRTHRASKSDPEAMRDTANEFAAR